MKKALKVRGESESEKMRVKARWRYEPRPPPDLSCLLSYLPNVLVELVRGYHGRGRECATQAELEACNARMNTNLFRQPELHKMFREIHWCAEHDLGQILICGETWDSEMVAESFTGSGWDYPESKQRRFIPETYAYHSIRSRDCREGKWHPEGSIGWSVGARGEILEFLDEQVPVGESNQWG